MIAVIRTAGTGLSVMSRSWRVKSNGIMPGSVDIELVALWVLHSYRIMAEPFLGKHSRQAACFSYA